MKVQLLLETYQVMCSIFDVLEPQHLPHTGNVEEMKLEH